MAKTAGAPAGASRTRHSQAASMIGQRIVSGEWTAGGALPTEADLSRELNVSRASLREAIKLLAGKGLIRSTPRRGTIVQPPATWNRLDPDVLFWQASDGPTTQFVRDLFELRRMIEPEAAALAASRAGPTSAPPIAEAFAAMETCRRRADLDRGRSRLSPGHRDWPPAIRYWPPFPRPSRHRSPSPSPCRAPARRSPMWCRCTVPSPSRSLPATPRRAAAR